MEQLTQEAQEQVQSVEQTSKVEFSPEQQEHINKLINKTYAKVEDKFEKRYKELEEAKKLQSMTLQEREEHEKKVLREELESYKKRELQNQFKIELTQKGITGDLVEYFDVNNAEKAKSAIDKLASYKQEIETPLLNKIKELEEQLRNSALRGSAPVIPNAENKQKQITGNFKL